MSEVALKLPNFHGNYAHGVDGSRRVMIPSKWRPKTPKVVFTVILWPIQVEEFLLVLPPERWQVMLDKLKGGSLQDRRQAMLERVIGSTSAPMTLDKQGRFCLPENLAGTVGIGKEAEFVGRLDKFEIWSPERYRESVAEDKSAAASFAAEINL